jgi:hypothetical protein
VELEVSITKIRRILVNRVIILAGQSYCLRKLKASRLKLTAPNSFKNLNLLYGGYQAESSFRGSSFFCAPWVLSGGTKSWE